jgi:tetratricopeptide (TPR) repeat protein
MFAAIMLGALQGAAAATEPPQPAPDLQAVQQFLEDRARKDPDDIITQNRLAEVYLQRLSENGDYEWLRRAQEAAHRSLASVPAEQNATGLFMQARVEYESHHFAAARDLASALIKIEPTKSRGFALLGDAFLEYGDLDEAAKAYEQMRERKAAAVEIEARLGHLDGARGDRGAARIHLEKAVAAARELSPGSPEIIASCLVQAGELEFGSGKWEEAEKMYQAALAERPADVGALVRLAELRGAQDKYDEAISLFEKAIAQKPRPEFWHALGDVFAAAGKPENAAQWHARARETYLKNAAEGNAHYFHHLAEFFSDTELNPEEALKWARRDSELRHTAAVQDALAWALYRNGDFKEAMAVATKAVARGGKDAEILAHAGTIFFAAGDLARSNEFLAAAALANPHYDSFHVHR